LDHIQRIVFHFIQPVENMNSLKTKDINLCFLFCQGQLLTTASSDRTIKLYNIGTEEVKYDLFDY